MRKYIIEQMVGGKWQRLVERIRKNVRERMKNGRVYMRQISGTRKREFQNCADAHRAVRRLREFTAKPLRVVQKSASRNDAEVRFLNAVTFNDPSTY